MRENYYPSHANLEDPEDRDLEAYREALGQAEVGLKGAALSICEAYCGKHHHDPCLEVNASLRLVRKALGVVS